MYVGGCGWVGVGVGVHAQVHAQIAGRGPSNGRVSLTTYQSTHLPKYQLTEQAEIINGRIAMAAVTTAVALSVDPTLKALLAVSKAASNVIADIAE